MKNAKNRLLKVAPRIKKNRFVSDRESAQLLLAGDWLKAAGFAAGVQVRVLVENARLTITPVIQVA